MGVGAGQFLILLAGAAALAAMPAAPQRDVLPAGAGKATFVEVCTLCHSTALPMGKQLTRQEWELKITEMLQEEPDVTRDERSAILEYVAANFKPGGKIYINQIVAKDLVTLLGISSSAADAIVKYRTTKGEFKNLDELKNVPGVDAAPIEARKDQLQF